jgi:tRNA(Ile)-lysidine synthase
MDVSIEPGKYVVAVSGGVDSVVLLDVLARRADLDLVVAHFDHGIRIDSAHDADFAQALAKQKKLPFISERQELGERMSEAGARNARYAFLQWVQKETGASAIITAHHQDDLLETAILNLLRGTGRKGVTSLQSRPGLLRPLLNVSKSDIKSYAAQQKLSWREDSTNYDERYTRNYIRHRLLVGLEPDTRQQLLGIITDLSQLNEVIDAELIEQIAAHMSDEGLDRRWFTQLPHDVSREVLAMWLRQHGVADFDRKIIERLTVQAKTKQPGKHLDVLHNVTMIITKDWLALARPER